MKHFVIFLMAALSSLGALSQTGSPTLPPSAVPYGTLTFLERADSTVWVGEMGSYVKVGSWRKLDSLLGVENLQKVTSRGNTTTNRIVIQGSSNPANGLNLSYVNGNGGGIYNRVSGADVNSLYLSNTGTFSLGNVNGIGMIRSRTQDGSNAGIEMVINSGGTASRVSGANALNNVDFVTLGQLSDSLSTRPAPTLQNVTNAGNTTTNAIQISGTGNLNTATNSGYMRYVSNNFQMGLLNGGATAGLLTMSPTMVQLSGTATNIGLLLQNGVAAFRLGTSAYIRVKGADATENEDFVTLAQLNAMGSGYLPLTGGTLTGDLFGTNADFNQLNTNTISSDFGAVNISLSGSPEGNSYFTSNGLGIGITPNIARASPLQVQGNIWSTDAYILGTGAAPTAEMGLDGASSIFIRTLGAGGITMRTNNTARLVIAATGELTASSLAGTGDAPVMANSSGQLSRGAFPAPQTLSLGANAGGIDLSGDGGVNLSSLARFTLVDFNSLNANPAGFYPIYNGSGSVNYPASTGQGIAVLRGPGTNNGAFSIWTAGNGTDELYYNTGNSTGWNGWHIIADRDWVSSNFVTTNTNQTAIIGQKEWFGRHVFTTTTAGSSVAGGIDIGGVTGSGAFIRAGNLTGGGTSFTIRGYATSGIQATFDAGGISVASGWIPTANNHVSTKEYVDNNFVNMSSTQSPIAGTKGWSGNQIWTPSAATDISPLTSIYVHRPTGGQVTLAGNASTSTKAFQLRTVAVGTVQLTLAAGGVDANGAYTNTSDSTLKDKAVYDYSAAANIPAQAFTWKDGRDSLVQVRYFAQEVREHLPNAVHENTETGLLSVDESQVLIAKVALLEKKNDELEAILQALTARVEALESKE